eukprot:COSAG03_NODE_1508_length_3959_cov_27.988601_3_plen_57_part_00
MVAAAHVQQEGAHRVVEPIWAWHKDLLDLYEKVSGKGGSVSGARLGAARWRRPSKS